MVGKGILVYGVVFTIILSFVILPNANTVYAATIETLKFDQSPIGIHHGNIITILTSDDPPATNESLTVTLESFYKNGKPYCGPSVNASKFCPTPLNNTITIEIEKRGDNYYWDMVFFTYDVTNPNGPRLSVKNTGSVNVTDSAGNVDVAYIIPNNNNYFNNNSKFMDIQSADCSVLGGDIDLDGICDDWEPVGGNHMEIEVPAGAKYIMDSEICDSFIQVDPQVPVPCMGSDKRDIYLEIDYMIGHKPNHEALLKVIDAFAKAPADGSPNGVPGIRLHIQVDHNKVSHEDDDPNLSGEFLHKLRIKHPGTNFHGKEGFDQIKARYFGTDDEQAHPDWGALQKKQIFHYALIVHKQGGTEDSGVAEVFGNDMMLNMGVLTGHTANPDETAGLLMHELGHNLNLEHGGVDDVNCKPNHLSVMNYVRQFNDPISDRSLDYSRQQLGSVASGDSLVEGHLDEPDGIERYIDDPITIVNEEDEATIFGNPTMGTSPIIPTGVDVDWNLNTDPSDMDQSVNINFIPEVGCDDPNTDETLMGSNDWDVGTMNLAFRDATGNFADGRPMGAVFQTGIWEEDGTTWPMILSQTCPSVEQIFEKAPDYIKGNVTDPNASNHAASVALMQEHLNNYRTCAGGSPTIDDEEIVGKYFDGALFSWDNILEFYQTNPEKLLDPHTLHVLTKTLVGMHVYRDLFNYHAAYSKIDVDTPFQNNLSLPDKEMLQINALKQNAELIALPQTLDITDISNVNSTLKEIHKDMDSSIIESFLKTKQTSIDWHKTNVDVFAVEHVFSKDEARSDTLHELRVLRVDALGAYLKYLDAKYLDSENELGAQSLDSENNEGVLGVQYLENSPGEIDVFPISQKVVDESFTLTTSEKSYEEGELIVVSGDITNILQGVPVTIKILREGNVIDVSQVLVDKDGKFTSTFNAQGPLWTQDGTYIVSALYGTTTLDTNFEYVGKGSVEETTEEGLYNYAAPVLDAVAEHLRNDRNAEAVMELDELDFTNKISNATELKYVNDAIDDMQESYSRAIPEFGTIAILVLVAAITSIIILTTKTRNILMPKY